MKRTLLAFMIASAIAPSVLRAQNCSSNPAPCSTAAGALQVTITIAKTVELTLSAASTSLATPSTADYNAGFAATNGPTATIRSNAPWAISISAVTATWSAVNTNTEPARTNKPASDLAWSTAPFGTYTDLTTLGSQVASGNATLASNVTLYYRTKYAWNLDTPGNYSLQIVFTVVAP